MFLKSLTLSNLLSFGPEPHMVELGPLNVIIGPNGSGKSNVIEAVGLLKAVATDIQEPIRIGGGVAEWLWKGSGSTGVAKIEAIVTDPVTDDETSPIHRDSLSYRLSFSEIDQRFHLRTEDLSVITHEEISRRLSFFEVQSGRVRRDDYDESELNKTFSFDRDQSILTQLSPPFNEKDSFDFAKRLKSIQIMKEIDVGTNAPARRPQKVDMPNVFLASDASNLGLVLNKIKRSADTRHALKAALQELYENIDDIDVQIEGGTVQVFVYEERMAVPATRLSSGTLRFLCLLAILCHPKPPPLICLEEPELGLHPDLIPTISRLLKEASERTQLIVTTHSDILVDTLTDRPEAVLVAEKGEGGTRLTRLDPSRLKPWLETYRLGQLWTSGEIGGVRW